MDYYINSVLRIFLEMKAALYLYFRLDEAVLQKMSKYNGCLL